MELSGIIFYIIIFIMIVSAKETAQSGNEHGKSTIPNITKREKSKTPNASERGKTTIPNAPKNEKTMIPNVPKNGKSTIPNVPKNGKTMAPNVPVKKKRERTILEPHREEKIQPRIRTNNLWGEDKYANQRIVALRLMEGDPVPEGYVRIRCPYCGADNLVTKNCKQYHSCYFCRVPID